MTFKGDAGNRIGCIIRTKKVTHHSAQPKPEFLFQFFYIPTMQYNLFPLFTAAVFILACYH